MASDTSANDVRDCSTASARRCPAPCTRYQREVVSTSQSTPLRSSDCTAGSMMPSSASMSPHRPTAPVMSRAMRNARTTSACETPVSVTIRDTNVIPWEFTTSLDAIVAMISRFNGCSASRWPNRSTITGGK